MAHDFNNLLAVILSYTEFVSDEVSAAGQEPGGERWAAVREDLEQVRRAADRAAELTHQLLAFARREVVRPQALLLRDVVADVESMLTRTLGEQVDLEIAASTGVWRMMADPGQLEQVLVNLAVNARDAMGDGGTLTIDTGDQVVDADHASARPGLEPGNYVRLRVSDSGAGMSQEALDRAVEPFFTTKRGGTGLGLATVYGIVTQAGGDLVIHSVPGVGTTVTMLFPATDKAPTWARAVRAVAQRHVTVLVVEDEDAMREVTRRILARNGHTVLVAAGGRDAVSIAERYQGVIDLLLTDVVMPEMLGKQVAALIGAARPDVRVLYMSGYARPIFTDQGTLDPGATLIEKPFTGAGLLAKVQEVVAS
ncbi:MAG: hypothetical protein QOJ92_1040 [Frankiales bacterium]|nr:hypothetical protein [Frankiales bacterium]